LKISCCCSALLEREQELQAYVAERVAPHKRIRAVEFMEQLPKSATGKLPRRVLIEREKTRASS